MLRFVVILAMLSVTAIVHAAEGDIPLAEVDKRYVADGVKQRDADIESREKQIVELNALIAKLKASGISEEYLKDVRIAIKDREGEIAELKLYPYIPPRLDPKQFAIGQVGVTFGDFSEGRAVIRVIKVINGNEMFAHIERTDVVVWLLLDTTNWEARTRETFDWKCAVVGTRTLNGQTYLCLSQYTPPEKRIPPGPRTKAVGK